MVKILVSAALVWRLKTRPMPLDLEMIALVWLRRPVIEIILHRNTVESMHLRRKLDEVYPF